jgi:uncharacterized protein with GYD domain
MPRYLVRASYSTQGVADLMKNPEDRASAVRPVIEGMGGRLESFDFVLGEDDVVFIAEFPDNVSAVAFSMAASATGAISSFKTSALLSAEEAMEAMKRAGRAGYRPPG